MPYSPMKSSLNPLRSISDNSELGLSPNRRLADDEVDYWRKKARAFENAALNLEDELVFVRGNLERMEELQEKVEMLLKQNTHLLGQNESLLRVIHQKKVEVETWKQRADSEYLNQQSMKASLEVNAKRAYDEIEKKELEHRIQIDRLLAEISRLQDHCAEIQSLKNIEIENVKAKYENENLVQLQSLKRSQHQNIELYEKEVRRLKEEAQAREIRAEEEARKARNEQDKLVAEVNKLNTEVAKVTKEKEQQSEFNNTQLEQQLDEAKRKAKAKEEQLVNSYNLKVKRLDHQIKKLGQQLEEQDAKFKATVGSGDTEIADLHEQKAVLRNEIAKLCADHENELEREKQRAQDSLSYEIHLLSEGHNEKVVFLESEIMLLKAILQTKSAENDRLVRHIELLRQEFEGRESQLLKELEECRKKIEDICEQNAREIETLKVRQAVLFDADIESLRRIFERQVEALNSELARAREIIRERNGEIDKLLREKQQMRKNYDKELDQEKSHQDNISLDFKSQIVQKDRELRQSVTKVEMVSQGLIKDNDAAQAKYRLLEAENAKLKSIVEDRNKEIKQLNERVKTLLKDREDEAVRLNQIIGDLTKHFEEEKHKADNDRQQFREALSKKEESYQQLNLNLNAQIKELQRQIQDNLKQIDDLKHAVSLKESSIAETQDKLKHELSHLSAEKGNAERLTLEKDTANSEMREKLINSQREQMEKMKKDLKDKLASYEHEIEDLKRQLAVKVRELEESEAREQGMGQRLDVMVESTQRLKDLQNRVMKMGVDKQFVKNVTEMFRLRHSDS